MALVPAASARLGGISVLFSEGRCNRSVQVHRLADAWTRTDLPPKSLLSCLVLHEKSAYIDVHIDLCLGTAAAVAAAAAATLDLSQFFLKVFLRKFLLVIF